MATLSKLRLVWAPEGVITKTVNLLKAVEDYGFHLIEWNPRTNPQNIQYADSVLSQGRRPVFRSFDNAGEGFTLQILDAEQPGVVKYMESLFEILELGYSYWGSTHQNWPVYFEMRLKGSSLIQYATVVGIDVPGVSNPFAQPFLGMGSAALLEGLEVNIERQQWGDLPAPNSTPLALTGFDDEYLDDGSFFVSMKAPPSQYAQLTHIFTHDGAVFSANLIGSDAYTLLPDVADTRYIYFGIQSATTFFDNLVFDLSTVLVGGSSHNWQYYTGSWVNYTAVEMFGNAIDFDNVGPSIVGFRHPFNVINTTINGVTGFWVRFSLTGAATEPVQQNRVVYTQPHNWVEVRGADINGTLPALLEVTMQREGRNLPTDTTVDDVNYRDIYIATRSKSREAGTYKFHPIIAFAPDSLQPSGITSTVSGAVQIAAQKRDTDFGYAFTNNGVAFDDETGYCDVNVPLTSGLGDSSPLDGVFRLLVRAEGETGGLGELSAIVQINQYDTLTPVLLRTPTISLSGLSSSLTGKLYDLGILDLTGYTWANRTRNALNFHFNLTRFFTGSANTNVFLYDFMLVPVDEFAMKISVAYAGSGLSQEADYVLSPMHPKSPAPTIGLGIYAVDGTITRDITVESNGPFGLQSGQDQRVYVFTNSTRHFSPVKLSKRQQYSLFRTV